VHSVGCVTSVEASQPLHVRSFLLLATCYFESRIAPRVFP
jgi:hypothetical protein